MDALGARRLRRLDPSHPWAFMGAGWLGSSPTGRRPQGPRAIVASWTRPTTHATITEAGVRPIFTRAVVAWVAQVRGTQAKTALALAPQEVIDLGDAADRAGASPS